MEFARKATQAWAANEYESDDDTIVRNLYDRSFWEWSQELSTIQSTVDAMLLERVAGAVTFSDGFGATYAEQVVDSGYIRRKQ